MHSLATKVSTTINYWSFGDYLGIGAGAHSKITQIDPAGGNLQINRYWKRRQPEQYLTDDGKFIAGSRLLDREEKISEFYDEQLAPQRRLFLRQL